MIQTREPLLYDSIKILLVKENIVEIEVCSVILPFRITALQHWEDGKGKVMECDQYFFFYSGQRPSYILLQFAHDN